MSYDNIYTQYYYDFACNSSMWAHPDPVRCGCRGKGWWSSELDTWHQCPCHGKGVPHPESYTESEEAEMAAAAAAPEPVVAERNVEDDDGLPF